MTKKAESTALATIIDQGQAGIPALLKKVTAQIKAIKGDTKEEASTKGKQLPGFGEIAKIDKVTTLVQAYSAVSNRAKAYKEAADAMGINTSKFPFKLESCGAKQWLDDIQARAVVVSHKAELDKLQRIKKKLEDNLSAEDKLKKDMQEISSILTDQSELE